MITDRYLQLKAGADRVLGGEWTPEEFEAYLDRVAAILAQKEEEVKAIEIPLDFVDDLREEFELGFTGMDLYNEGLAEMRLFVDDGNPEHLERGLQLVLEGNEYIGRAVRPARGIPDEG